MGIQSVRKSLPLAVGGAVHTGLATLLEIARQNPGYTPDLAGETLAVEAALADFASFDAGRLETDLSEDVDLSAMDAGEREKVRSAIDQYLYDENRALVEAMVRAYARRRLRPLLEQYEVLEVEREGSWELADGLMFMSRPDALLRDRQDGNLYIQSFKTGASWDVRKGKDAEHDAQGLSEGVEIEKRLGERVLGIRYEFLWKGERRRDKDLSARFGVEARSQASPLVRGYLSPGMTDSDAQWNWSWDYMKEGGETSKLYWKAWRAAAVWEHMPIAKWIDMLDATTLTVGEEGREVGWSGPAQATGFTVAHPLDACFHPPIIQYRNDDDLRDWVEQVEHAEVRIAEAVATVHAATDEGEKRHLLNVYFPQSRRECVYPSVCQFEKICYGGEHIRYNPLESGLYTIRIPNHPQEDAKDASEGA
jgi:hypothetical protein